MESVMQFLVEYESLKERFSTLYLIVKQVRNNSRWRVEMYNADPEHGDTVVLHAESDEKEKAFKKALEKIKDIENNINEPKGYTINGQKVHRKA